MFTSCRIIYFHIIVKIKNAAVKLSWTSLPPFNQLNCYKRKQKTFTQEISAVILRCYSNVENSHVNISKCYWQFCSHRQSRLTISNAELLLEINFKKDGKLWRWLSTFSEHISESANWYQMWNSSHENLRALSNVYNTQHHTVIATIRHQMQ